MQTNSEIEETFLMTRPRTQLQRMLAGELYMANDPQLHAAHLRAQALLAMFNGTPADANDERHALLTDRKSTRLNSSH